MSRRAAWDALGATLALAAVVYVVRLGTPSWGAGPPRYLFDEKYTAFTANRVVKGDPAAYRWAARRYELAATDTSDLTLTSRAEWTSPPGAPLAVAPFIAALGFSAVAVRLAAVLAALIALAATAWLAGLNRAWAACALLAFDGVFFVLARTAMPYMFLVAGVTVGAALLVAALRFPRYRLPAAIGAGIAFGFATSVRLTAIPLTAALIAALVVSKEGVRERFWRPGLTAGVVAVATYFATFLPHIWHGGQSVADIVRFHQKLAWFHAHVPADFPQVTPWYAWPWALRPVVFGGETAAAGEASVVWCVGGKLLWWAVVPAAAYALWRVRQRDWRDLVPLAGILATWLPWAPLNRFGMFYYLLPALPFAAILVARALEESRIRWLRPAYVAMAVALFAAMYPVLAAVPLGQQALQRYSAALGVPVGRANPASSTPYTSATTPRMMRLAVQLPWHFSLLLVLAPACRSPAAPGDAGTTTSAIAATGSAGAAARPDGRGGRKQGKVVLGTFAVPGAPGRAFQVAIGSCEANECPVLVTLVEDGRALAEQQVGFASSTQEVTRTDAERGWGASDMVETAAVPAWVTGEDATFLATMARPVNLAPGVAGLLIDQVAGFEHLKRTHALLAAVDGQLIKAWSFREGAGWTYSTTAVVALGPDRQGVALFDAFDHSHDSDTEPDTLNTAVLAWDPKSRKADPLRRPGLLRAVVIGPFKSIKAAQHARNRKPGCLEGFYVLPAGQVRSARRDGYVLVRPTAVAAAATALAEKQKGCAPGVRAAVMALP